jgi:peptidoglycan hydrolase-like protein with peptidoglycan-binding domain
MEAPAQTVALEELTSAQIRDLQTALAHHGEVLRIDGKLGPETRAAVAAFQTRNDIAVTEALDTTTLTQLGLPQNEFMLAH